MKSTARICPKCLNEHLEGIICPDPNVIRNSRKNRRELARIMRKANYTMKKNGFKTEIELSFFQKVRAFIIRSWKRFLKS